MNLAAIDIAVLATCAVANFGLAIASCEWMPAPPLLIVGRPEAFWHLRGQAIYTMRFMDRVSAVFVLWLAGAVLVSLVAPQKKAVSIVTLEGISYKTSTVFNIAGFGVILIMIALYPTW